MRSIYKFLHPLIVILFCGTITQLASQDIIHLMDGNQISSSIKEIHRDRIHYYRYGTADAQVYELGTADVTKIVFENGIVQYFNDIPVGIDPITNNKTTPQPPGSGINSRTKDKAPASQASTSLPEVKRETARTNFGITVGVNGASGLYTYQNIAEPPFPSPGLTFTGGLVFEWNVTRNFHFQMNLLYKGKGDRIAMANFAESLDLPPVNNHVLSAEGEGFVSRTVHYAEFSLIPTLSFPSASGKSKFLLGLGGYYGSAISGSKNADYTLRFYQDGELTTEDIVDETKDMVIVDLFPTDNNPDEIYIRRFDYGMHGLIGWRMPKLMYGLSTSLGMVEIEPDELFARKIKPRETRHVVVTLFFSYYFTS